MRTLGSLAADSVYCARVGLEIYFLLTFDTAPFVCVNILFLTWELPRVEWLVSRPGRFTPRKYLKFPIGWDVGWASEPVRSTWKEGKSSLLQELEI
jgi:hypothetical protein